MSRVFGLKPPMQLSRFARTWLGSDGNHVEQLDDLRFCFVFHGRAAQIGGHIARGTLS
jgi:hypothetical protein